MELVEMCVIAGVILFIFFLLAGMTASNLDRDRQIRELQLILKADGTGQESFRLLDLERKLDNLPQSKAKVALEKLEEVKQIMAELEE